MLLYDDDADILEICTYILQRKGYLVASRRSCTQVLDDLREEKPDVVIMDNWIPDIGGVEATKLIKGSPEFADLPVILFTANKNIYSLSKDAGADAFIAKPFDMKEMEQTVAQVLQKTKPA